MNFLSSSYVLMLANMLYEIWLFLKTLQIFNFFCKMPSVWGCYWFARGCQRLLGLCCGWRIPDQLLRLLKSQNLWLESLKNSSYVLILSKYAIWNDDLDELFELSSHRFWLYMVSSLDLGYSNHSTSQATTGNLIATSCQCHFGQKVGYF